jgi:hypothetical protein
MNASVAAEGGTIAAFREEDCSEVKDDAVRFSAACEYGSVRMMARYNAEMSRNELPSAQLSEASQNRLHVGRPLHP